MQAASNYIAIFAELIEAMPKTRFKALKNEHEVKRSAKPSEVNISEPTAGSVQEAKGPSQGQEITVSRNTVVMSEAVAKGKPADESTESSSDDTNDSED